MRKINYFSLIFVYSVTLGHADPDVRLSRSVSCAGGFSGKVAGKKPPPSVTAKSPLTAKKTLPVADGEESYDEETLSEDDMEEIFLEKKREGLTRIDPTTGIEYYEFVDKNGEVIIIYRDPSGRVSKMTRAFLEAKLAFSNENLAESLKEEEFLEDIEKSLRKAIKDQSPRVVKNLLKLIPDPEIFINRFPNLLCDAQRILDERDADEEIHETIIDFLLDFGYLFEED
jgi:hypothetical protein